MPCPFVSRPAGPSAISRRGFNASIAAFVLTGANRAAAAIEVDLQLVLAVDASGSDREHELKVDLDGRGGAVRTGEHEGRDRRVEAAPRDRGRTCRARNERTRHEVFVR